MKLEVLRVFGSQKRPTLHFMQNLPFFNLFITFTIYIVIYD